MLICHLCIFFGEAFVKVFGPFVKIIIIVFKKSLCILDNSPLSDLSFANIFSQSVACLLILLALSFRSFKFQ